MCSNLALFGRGGGGGREGLFGGSLTSVVGFNLSLLNLEAARAPQPELRWASEQGNGDAALRGHGVLVVLAPRGPGGGPGGNHWTRGLACGRGIV